MQKISKPVFNNSKQQRQFYQELLKRVNRYFRLYGVEKTGHWRMLVKKLTAAKKQMVKMQPLEGPPEKQFYYVFP